LIYTLSEDPELNIELLNKIEVASTVEQAQKLDITDQSLIKNSSFIGDSRLTRETKETSQLFSAYKNIQTPSAQHLGDFKGMSQRNHSQMQVKVAPVSRLNHLALPQIKEGKCREQLNTFDSTNRYKSTLKIGLTERVPKPDVSLLSELNQSGRNSNLMTYHYMKDSSVNPTSVNSRN